MMTSLREVITTLRMTNEDAFPWARTSEMRGQKGRSHFCRCPVNTKPSYLEFRETSTFRRDENGAKSDRHAVRKEIQRAGDASRLVCAT